jgi:hypothetical protein
MSNKRLERWYIEQLRRAVPDFPPGTVHCDESPDFLVQGDQRTIGIEVTVFHCPSPEGKRPHQEEQALKDRVVAAANKIHAEAGGLGLYVTVFFARPTSITKHDVREQGAAIARAVAVTAPPGSLAEPAMRVPWDRLPPGVTDITIRPSIDGQDRLWSADAGGWVARVGPTQIQAVLDRKRAMASRALAKCDEMWLIIVNDEFSRGAPVELPEESGQADYDHRFDRLFWLEPHRQRALELWSASRLPQTTRVARGAWDD